MAALRSDPRGSQGAGFDRPLQQSARDPVTFPVFLTPPNPPPVPDAPNKGLAGRNVFMVTLYCSVPGAFVLPRGFSLSLPPHICFQWGKRWSQAREGLPHSGLTRNAGAGCNVCAPGSGSASCRGSWPAPPQGWRLFALSDHYTGVCVCVCVCVCVYVRQFCVCVCVRERVPIDVVFWVRRGNDHSR